MRFIKIASGNADLSSKICASNLGANSLSAKLFSCTQEKNCDEIQN